MFYVFALAVLAASASGGLTKGRPPVLVLSFDGVSAEAAKGLASLQSFTKKAASAGYVKSVFPTKTFSTHFSVATGVKPSVHGVVGNTQYDKNDVKVRNHPNQYRFVPDINPIWIENEDDEERNSGTMMWPGAQFKYRGTVIDSNKTFASNFKDDGNDEPEEEDGSQTDDDNYKDGKRADFFVHYKPKSLTWEERADKIIEWLTSDEKKCNLVMAYFEDFGSLDAKTKDTVKQEHINRVDQIIKYIHDNLDKKGLNDQVDIIFMSDHGTSPTTGSDIIMIDEILEITDEPKNILSSGPLAYISPEEGEIDLAHEQLVKGSENGKLYTIYKKKELKWGLDKCDIILNQFITVVANPPHTFYTQPYLNAIKSKYGLDKADIVQDVNGYDNDVAAMNGFFYGIGPSFKDNVHLDGQGFDLDEIYPLIKKLIGLPLADSSSVQNNNDLDKVVIDLLEPSVVQA